VQAVAEKNFIYIYHALIFLLKSIYRPKGIRTIEENTAVKIRTVKGLSKDAQTRIPSRTDR
jgi:hypothetical protein